MPVDTSVVTRVFGGATTDQATRAGRNPSQQKVGEVVTTSGTFRKVRGPRGTGHYSYHIGVTEASAGGGITVWYSNLPNPDETADGDWFQDTTIGTIATTAVATFGGNVGNVTAEWVRFKCLPTGDSASVWAYYAAEGREMS